MKGIARRGRSGRVSLAVVGAILLGGATTSVAETNGALVASGSTAPVAARCPWATAQAERTSTPSELADDVLARMTLGEKLGMVALETRKGYENTNAGDARLCIPRLTLEDGPAGIAYDDTGVTQLPAPIALAATFDAALATVYGKVIGSEAAGQGVDSVQGPDLNLDRIPTSGRSYEGFGEDPFLAARIGVAEIEGIQSRGVMAEAKHLAGYTQETARLDLDQTISPRVLQEVDLEPFKAAVEQGHVASVMCAYGQIDGTYACQDAPLIATMRQSWGFSGFVRTDLGAAPDPVAAILAGVDAIKPDPTVALRAALSDHQVTIAVIDDAVRRILLEMFSFGLIERPPTGRPHKKVATAEDASAAVKVAEDSAVLLRNSKGLLPLAPTKLRSLAVIGVDAGADAATAGNGSARVRAPFLVTPETALRATYRTARVTYTPASSTDPVLSVFAGAGADYAAPLPPGSVGVGVPLVTIPAADQTADEPGTGPGWMSESTTITANSTGTDVVGVSDFGDAFLSLDGSSLFTDRGLHDFATQTVPITVSAGRQYTFTLDWYQVNSYPQPTVTVQDVNDSIVAAAHAARSAQVAVVFVNDVEDEGVDRPSLALPGDDDALIAAVAGANPDSVVVVNSGGPVLMPWLHKVAAVVEAWYPGEEDGTAITAVLSGGVDPEGRLPVTFPASQSQTPEADPSESPGVDGLVSTDEGLDIGYREYLARGMVPMFPFGFGLSYTTFSLSQAQLTRTAGGVRVSVRVRDTGSRAGSDVVEVYLRFPPSAGEPPEQLKGFATVSLDAGAQRAVQIDLPTSAFQAYLHSRWTTVAGTYVIAIGSSSEDLSQHLELSEP